MRIRSAALLLALIALAASAAVAPAAQLRVPPGFKVLTPSPPVLLSQAAQPGSTTPASAPLARTGINVGLVLATGSVMLALGIGMQRAARRRRW